MLAIGAQTGPVFLTYAASKPIDALVARATVEAPLFDFVAPDDVQSIFPQTVAHRLIPVGDAGRGPIEQVRAMLEGVALP